MLDARRAQAREAVLIDRLLPAQEFLDREGIAPAGLLEAEEPAAHRGHDLGLAADDPSARRGRGKIGDGQGTAIRTDDVFHPRTVRLGHDTLTHSTDHWIRR